ncbi:MAG: hypothetical protein R3F43_09050 [bacterium]
MPRRPTRKKVTGIEKAAREFEVGPQPVRRAPRGRPRDPGPRQREVRSGRARRSRPSSTTTSWVGPTPIPFARSLALQGKAAAQEQKGDLPAIETWKQVEALDGTWPALRRGRRPP